MATTESWMFVLKLAAALGCGLVAGVFFAFSSFVMQALGQQPTAQGIATMQAINVTAINPWFMGVLFGTAAVCGGLAIAALIDMQHPSTRWLLLGCLLYLVGAIGVTIGGNVPLNDALAAVAPDSAEGAKLWTNYLTRWTLWNHIRTAAALGAAALLTIAG